MKAKNKKRYLLTNIKLYDLQQLNNKLILSLIPHG